MAAVALMLVAGGFMMWAAARGMGESKFDGWSPVDALSKRNPQSKDE